MVALSPFVRGLGVVACVSVSLLGTQCAKAELQVVSSVVLDSAPREMVLSADGTKVVVATQQSISMYAVPNFSLILTLPVSAHSVDMDTGATTLAYGVADAGILSRRRDLDSHC